MNLTNSINPIDTVEIIDPRINLDNKRMFTVFKGPLNSDLTVRYAAGNSSISQVLFNVINPNIGVAIERKVYVDIEFEVSFTGIAPAGANLLDGLGHSLAPRDLPLARSTRSCTARINNSAVSLQTMQMIDAMRHYHLGSQDDKYDLSLCPYFPDQDQNYTTPCLLNSIRNPLSSYGNSENGESEKRGAFSGMRVMSNTPTSGVIRLRTVEPLFVSPLAYSGTQSALYHVQNLDITLLLDSNIGNILFSGINEASHTSYSQFTTKPQVTIVGVPQLLLNFMKIRELEYVPETISYPYYDTQVFTQDVLASTAPYASFTVNLNAIQLSTIPQRVYIYAKRREQDVLINTTDTFARLDNIQFTLGANNSVLSAATTQELYQMSRKNGLTMSYNQYYGNTGIGYKVGTNRQYNGIGSVFCAEFGSDIGLQDELLTPGQQKVDTLQIRATFTNLDGLSAINFIVYVVIVNPGIFTISKNLKAFQEIGIITRQNVLDAKQNNTVSYEIAKKLEGSSFFGNVKHFFSKIPEYYQKAKPVLKGIVNVAESTGIPQLQTAAKLAHMVGLGCGGSGLIETSGGCMECPGCEQCGSGVVGGKMKKYKKTKGGRLISRFDL